MPVFQLVGVPVIDVVADILFVGQHLMDGATGPGAVEIRLQAALVQQRRDLAFEPAAVDELPVNPPNILDFVVGSGNQDDPIGLQALVLASGEYALGLAVLVDTHAA